MGTVSLLAFAVFLLVTAPVLTFLHELGHAIPALLFGADPVTIELGTPEAPARTITLGRLRMRFRPFPWTYGFVGADLSHASTGQRIVTAAGGPLVSVATVVVLGLILRFAGVPGWLELSLGWALWGAGLSVLFTLIPIRYPAWFGSYAGMPSDGLRMLTTWRERNLTGPSRVLDDSEGPETTDFASVSPDRET